MRKVISILIAVYISIFLVTSVSASTVYVNDFFKYTVERGSVTIVGYYGQETEVTVPFAIAGNPVNTIATGAFSECVNVIKIILPDTIMTIENGAFRADQSIVYQNNTSNGNDNNKKSEVAEANSSNKISSADDLRKSGNQETTKTTENKIGQTNNHLVGDNQQPLTGVDEQVVVLDSEDDSKQKGSQSVSNNSLDKQQGDYTWLLAAVVLCVLIVGGIVYAIVRKNRI